jgi:hypothetical protein
MRTAYDVALSVSAGLSAAILYEAGQGPGLDAHVLRWCAAVLWLLLVAQLPCSCVLWLLDDLQPTDEH